VGLEVSLGGLRPDPPQQLGTATPRQQRTATEPYRGDVLGHVAVPLLDALRHLQDVLRGHPLVPVPQTLLNECGDVLKEKKGRNTPANHHKTNKTKQKFASNVSKWNAPKPPHPAIILTPAPLFLPGRFIKSFEPFSIVCLIYFFASADFLKIIHFDHYSVVLHGQCNNSLLKHLKKNPQSPL
jgi:hypothetical protein